MAKLVRPEQIAELRRIGLSFRADPSSLTRAELATATRTICSLLAQRHPGGTVELRVPPFAAVQLGLGDRGRHTRGTPPNVVQTDPATLLQLSTGRLSWELAVSEHHVSASGIHSDLVELWPLPELAS